MRSENVPSPPNPAEPPLAPHDLPEPVPQAAAWRRALRVVASSAPRVPPHSRPIIASERIARG
jgi:hypothetical protein